MGVDGLLSAVKEAFLDVHVRDYAGQTVVVDALSWLHKACYGCAWDLAVGNDTETYVKYVVRRAEMLQSVGIKPILVFDGRKIPLKANTHGKRQASKEDNRELGMQHLREAKGLSGDERKEIMAKTATYFQRSINITSAIIKSVHKALRQAKINFVTAPFEADAQMVYLCKINKAAAIITEDSDILVYCAAANVNAPVLFKLDESGLAKMLSIDRLHKEGKHGSNAVLRKVSLFLDGTMESTRMFVQASVLAGCDFLESLPRIGIAKAFTHVFNFRGVKGSMRIPRLFSKLKFEGIQVPTDYLDRFYKAEALFYYHYVFHPAENQCQFLFDGTESECIKDIYERVQESLGDATILGTHPSEEIMIEIYYGRAMARQDSSQSSWSSQTYSQSNSQSQSSSQINTEQPDATTRQFGSRGFGTFEQSPKPNKPAKRQVVQCQNTDEVLTSSMGDIFQVYGSQAPIRDSKRGLSDDFSSSKKHCSYSSDSDEPVVVSSASLLKEVMHAQPAIVSTRTTIINTNTTTKTNPVKNTKPPPAKTITKKETKSKEKTKGTLFAYFTKR
ncbi:hypothetical protein THRCLA_09871 [Thraustotheca clavata]|uniref:Exonuclease 1 n=1 Tax=Thraustotheca clavata TaxID=74557 RepID=A0A1V9YU47_9STRA|nr:hypothetical protein THRCLA_09871 [Thraustotheca clavata]